MRKRPFGPYRPGKSARPRPRRPTLEAMEARQLLATFVVSNAGDSGPGSLRQAIISANTTSGTDLINFAIPANQLGPIQVLTPLPTVTDAVTIDATTQPGAGATPAIELVGTMAGAGANGLTLSATGITVKGLAIENFDGSGILINAPGADTVQGNFIGTNAAGTAAAPNGVGITLVGSQNNILGGTTSSAQNLISGNRGAGVAIVGAASTGNLVQGNVIGLRLSGDAALANANGVVISGDGSANSGARNNTVGGANSAARNVISGNTGAGVIITDQGATGNGVQGNFIGTNTSGSAAVGNKFGIQVLNTAATNTIGGTAIGASNLISGNADIGVSLDNSTSNTIQGNLIGTTQDGTAALPGTNTTIAGIRLDDGSSTNVIGGPASGARNVISGLAGAGLVINGRTGTTGNFSNANTVQGNLIGTNSAGIAAVPNAGNGVVIQGGATGTILGGNGAGARNIISGNKLNGVLIQGSGTTGQNLQGNLIGVQQDGATTLPNLQDGVKIDDSASNNTIGGTATGAGNTIAFSGQAGVEVVSGIGNTIRQNSIFKNSGLGIDLDPKGPTPNDAGDPDSGPNNLQNFPVITSVLTTTTTTNGTTTTTTTVAGTLNSTPSSTFAIDFYSNPAADAPATGQGRNYVGTTTVTTDASGNATFSFALPNPAATGALLTATATKTSTGDTSEFAANVTNAQPSADLNVVVTNVSPSGTVAAGALVTYTIVVGNNGPNDATNAKLTYSLPMGLSFFNATSSQGTAPTLTNGVVTAPFGTLARGQTATVTITAATALPSGVNMQSVTSTFTATSDLTDSNMSNNSATITTTLQQSADLQVVASANPSPATVNQNVTFTFVVTNNGPAAADNVVVRDVLPPNAALVSTSQTQGNVATSPTLIGWALGSLASGASAAVTVTLAPTVTGTFGNAASVSSSQADAVPSNNTAGSIITVNTATTPTSTDGPQVSSLARAGFHDQQTTFTLTFNQPLDATSAQDLANYTLLARGRDGRFGTRDDVPIDLRSAVYNATANTVTLTPIRRQVPLKTSLKLTVNGLAPRGVKGTNGLFLDGARTGQPGSDYTAIFQGFGSGPNGPQGGNPPTQAAASARSAHVPLDTRILNHVARKNPPFGKSGRDRA